MSKRILLAAVALFVFSGCTTLGRGAMSRSNAADAGDDESIFGGDVVASAPEDATPPDQMEVSWQDNGQSIRPLTPAGQARSLKVPATKVQKRSNVTATAE